MQMEAGLDTGPMLGAAQRRSIAARKLPRQLHGAAGRSSAPSCCLKHCTALEAGTVRAAEQPDSGRDLRRQDRQARSAHRLGAERRSSSTARCGPSIPGRWPRRSGTASSCASGRPSARQRRARPSARAARPGSRALRRTTDGALRPGVLGDATAARRPARRRRANSAAGQSLPGRALRLSTRFGCCGRSVLAGAGCDGAGRRRRRRPLGRRCARAQSPSSPRCAPRSAPSPSGRCAGTGGSRRWPSR